MNFEDLIFGVGLMLRERVDGWAQTENGTPHVYPDYPPLKLSKQSYPRATIDTTGVDPGPSDIEGDAYFGSCLVQVSVFGVNSIDVVTLTSDVRQAVVDWHDGRDTDGDPYLDEWTLDAPDTTSQLIEQETEPGFTRYQKTQDFVFDGVTIRS